jgi:hypothetical protein
LKVQIAVVSQAAIKYFMKPSLIVIVAFLLTGCQSSRPGASLTAEQAEVLAVQLANTKTDAFFHCQPFHDGQPPRFEAGHWIWTDSRGLGLGDIQARVDLAADGSTNSVDIKLLDSKNSMLPAHF